jgi:hypothetical protein
MKLTPIGKRVLVNPVERVQEKTASSIVLPQTAKETLFNFPAICRAFRSGAEGIRTPDLRRAKADPYVPACPSVSCYVAYLRGF